MRKLCPALLLLAAASPGFGQFNPNTVTITAIRSTTLQPDQAVLGVTVYSNSNTAFSDVLAAVQSVGITAANLTGVFSPVGTVIAVITPGPPPGTPIAPALQWAFSLPVPVSQLNSTLSTLSNLQNTIAQNNNGMQLTFSVVGAQVSPQLLQSQQCSFPDLMSDARAQAQKLVDATGFTLGPVMAVSGPNPTAVPVAVYGAVFPNFTASFLLAPVPSVQNCSITVTFALYAN